MCTHYKNDPEAISNWAEYAGFRKQSGDVPASDVWPKKLASVARIEDGEKTLDTLIWGVSRTMPGKGAVSLMRTRLWLTQ